MVNLFWISGFDKNRGILMVKTGNENEVNIKEISLKCQATGSGFQRQLRGPRALFLALGRMTYSHFPNRIFV